MEKGRKFRKSLRSCNIGKNLASETGESENAVENEDSENVTTKNGNNEMEETEMDEGRKHTYEEIDFNFECENKVDNRRYDSGAEGSKESMVKKYQMKTTKVVMAGNIYLNLIIPQKVLVVIGMISLNF